MENSQPALPRPLPWQHAAWMQVLGQLSGRRMAHAYLLWGQQGTGKGLFARALAARLLCQQPEASYACGQCRACTLQLGGNHPDFLLIEPEENSALIKIAQIRKINDFVQQTSSQNTSRKLIILEPAEGLNIAAANALLKNLEEPPGDTLFLLVSHLKGSVLPTILSRCQALPLPPADPAQALQWLDGVSDSPDLKLALSLAPGRPLAALGLIEEDIPALRQQILSGLHSLHDRQILPIDLARQGSEQNPGYVLGFMQEYVAGIIKLLYADNTAALAKDVLGSLQQYRSIPSQQHAIQGLFGFYRKLQQFHKQLAGTSNPNPLLMLEEVFWCWQELVSSWQR